MAVHLVGLDLADGRQVGHQRMVAGQALDGSRADAVGAAVADVADDGEATFDQGQRQRAAEPPCFRVLGGVP